MKRSNTIILRLHLKIFRTIIIVHIENQSLLSNHKIQFILLFSREIILFFYRKRKVSKRKLASLRSPSAKFDAVCPSMRSICVIATVSVISLSFLTVPAFHRIPLFPVKRRHLLNSNFVKQNGIHCLDFITNLRLSL